MATTIKARLVDAGWTDEALRTFGKATVIAVRGQILVEPGRRGQGTPVALRDLLPPGAEVTVGGKSYGRIDYSQRGYIAVGDSSHTAPKLMLVDLLEADAEIIS